MSESQTKLVEVPEAEAKPKKKAASRINSQEMYQKVEASNEKLYSQILETNKSLCDNIGDASKQMVEVTDAIKLSNDRVVCTLIETEEKIETLTQITDVLNQRLCELQLDTAPAAPEILPASGGLVEVSEPVSTAPVEVIDEEPIKENSSSRELFEKCTREISRRDGELADKSYSNILEKICLLREDFGKLCGNMRKQIDSYSAKDVLGSFEAYLVDIENLLESAGIAIGPYGQDGEQVNTQHQRIVGVIPTSDASKNGTVAERLSDGYEYKGRAVVKEKVNVYKLSESTPAQSDAPVREILG